MSDSVLVPEVSHEALIRFNPNTPFHSCNGQFFFFFVFRYKNLALCLSRTGLYHTLFCPKQRKNNQSY